MPLPLALPLIAAGAQTATGAIQMLQARKAQKAAKKQYEANPYQIPESAIRSVNKFGTLAKGTRMPGQDLMEENLRSDTASTLAQARKSATTPSQVLASTVGLYQQQQEAQRQMNIDATQDYRQRQAMYANAIASIAPYEVERWKYKTLYPVQAELNRASGLQGAAWQNIGQGLKSGLNVLSNQMAQKQYAQELGGLLGTGGGMPTQISQQGAQIPTASGGTPSFMNTKFSTQMADPQQWRQNVLGQNEIQTQQPLPSFTGVAPREPVSSMHQDLSGGVERASGMVDMTPQYNNPYSFNYKGPYAPSFGKNAQVEEPEFTFWGRPIGTNMFGNPKKK